MLDITLQYAARIFPELNELSQTKNESSHNLNEEENTNEIYNMYSRKYVKAFFSYGTWKPRNKIHTEMY